MDQMLFDIDKYAKGVFLTDDFKNKSKKLPEEIKSSKHNIYGKENVQKITSDKWLFAITLFGSLSAPISTIEKRIDEVIESTISFESGFLYKIPYENNEANCEPTFVVVIDVKKPKDKNQIENKAESLSDVLLVGLSLSDDLNGELYSIIHSFRPLTAQEYDDAREEELDFERINRIQPLKETGNVVHCVMDEWNCDFKLFTDTFSFLNQESSQKRQRKIKTSYSMIHDGMKARTKEQGFLTLYTALNYLIEDIGRQSRTAKSEAQMTLKMADKDIISIKTGIDWIEALKQIHNIRSNILWKADSINDSEYTLIKDFIQEFLPLYFEYWRYQSDR